MKIALFLCLFSMSAFAGTKKIRICINWWYRTDLNAWVCDSTPKWIEVVTPGNSEEVEKDQPIETDQSTKPEDKR